MAESDPNKTGNVVLVVGFIILALVAYWYVGGGFEQQVQQEQDRIRVEGAKEVERIQQQVATDTERQYQIAKKNGSAMDACVQAGMVAAAHLQAKNESAYKRWKDIEKSDCGAAGLPR